MIELIFGDNSNDLANALAERAQRHKDGSFSSSVVALSDLTLKKSLLFNLANQSSIAAGYDFTNIEQIFRSYTNFTSPDAHCLSVTQFAFRILDTLSLPSKKLHPRLLRLLSQLGDSSESADKNEIAEFSFRLAQLFHDVFHEDPKLLLSPPDELATTWQLDLYGRLKETYLQKEVSFLTLPLILSDAIKPTRFERIFHIFGVAQMTPGNLLCIQKLSETAGCHFILYAENPCREYWEDIVFSESSENILLTKWANQVRTIVSNASNVVNQDHEWLAGVTDDRASSHQPSTLEQIQHATKHRLAPVPLDELAKGDRAFHEDSSLVFREAPSPRREIEEAAKEIGRSLQADPTLCLDDIAIFCANDRFETYEHLVPSILLEFGEFRFSIHHSNLRDRSPIAKLFEACLNLPHSDFRRQEVLAVLSHPNLNTHATPEEKAHWPLLVSSLAIYKGMNQEYNTGTYMPANVSHWQQGIDKIARRTVLSKDTIGETKEQNANTKHELAPISNDRRRSALLFACVSRTLLLDARQAANQATSCSQWATWWLDFIHDYFQTSSPNEERELAIITKLLWSLSDIQSKQPPINLIEFRTIVLSRMASMKRPHTQASGAITMSPLSSRSSRVFRHTYVLGLTSTFPKTTSKSPWDIRDNVKTAGLQREHGLQALLNCVMQTTEKLVLSYPTSEPDNGHEINKSALLEDLENACRSVGAAPSKETSSLNRTHSTRPLEPHENALDPLSQRMNSLAKCTENNIEDDSSSNALLSSIEDGCSPSLQDRHLDATKSLVIRDILQFLAFPHQGWSKRVLNIQNNAITPHYDHDVPLTLNTYRHDELLKSTIVTLLKDPSRSDFLLEQFKIDALKGSDNPIGLFGDIALKKATALLRSWQELSSDSTEQFQSISIGNHPLQRAPDERLPPLAFQANRLFVGAPLLLVKNQKTLSYFMTKDKVSSKDILLGCLDAMALTMTSKSNIESLEFITPTKRKIQEVSVPSKEESTAYFESVLNIFYNTPHDYFLTLDAALEAIKKAPPSMDSLLDKHRAQFKRNAHFFNRPFAHELPNPKDASCTIDALYRPLMKWTKF